VKTLSGIVLPAFNEASTKALSAARALADKVARRVVGTSEERFDAEEKLYAMVLLLQKEGRITGDFTLQPFKDKEIGRLDERIDNLTKRFDNAGIKGIER
jgi:hypothetical protein